LYLVGQVQTDAEEQRVRSVVDEKGLFTKGGLHPAKLLFASTAGGSAAMARQLEADAYIGHDAEVVKSIAQFHKCVVCLTMDEKRSTQNTDAALAQLLERRNASIADSVRTAVESVLDG
jgi:hypothetical protein